MLNIENEFDCISFQEIDITQKNDDYDCYNEYTIYEKTDIYLYDDHIEIWTYSFQCHKSHDAKFKRNHDGSFDFVRVSMEYDEAKLTLKHLGYIICDKVERSIFVNTLDSTDEILADGYIREIWVKKGSVKPFKIKSDDMFG